VAEAINAGSILVHKHNIHERASAAGNVVDTKLNVQSDNEHSFI